METSGARAHDYLYAIPGAAIGGGLPVALGADCLGNGCACGSRVDSRGLPYRFQEGDVEERPRLIEATMAQNLQPFVDLIMQMRQAKA